MDDLMITAAAFFRNRGKNVVTAREFAMTMSFDLRWMSHGDAEKLLSLLSGQGLVKREDEYVRPAFDVAAVDVPLGFKPPADLLKRTRPKRMPDGDLLSELMGKAGTMGIERKDFIVSVNAIQKRMNIDIEVAALLLLREKGIDISGYADTAYGVISKR
ncbi:MAG: DUF2240 family protein [Methanomassiliicoccaceae archaeon]|jgi:hypothetical protein|nr:DUF2240 family protein [Methanomassiliicoccaceae archaeon]